MIYKWKKNMSSLIPKCHISHNSPFCNSNVHTCALSFCKMVQFRIRNWYTLGFVQLSNFIGLPTAQIRPAVQEICSLAHGQVHLGQFGKYIWSRRSENENMPRLMDQRMGSQVENWNRFVSAYHMTRGHAYIGQMGKHTMTNVQLKV